jgi:MoaA/NifB/PqqE/SkfB family radical SAM enzyme
MVVSMSRRQNLINLICDRFWKKFDPQEQFFHIQLDITNACNLVCDHCYCPHHKNDGAFDYDEWGQVLDIYEALLNKLHMKAHVTLCGGEPTLAPFIIPLLENIRKRFREASLSIQSNGTRITEELARTCKVLDVSFQISIDGPDATRNDQIRGDGSFEKAIAGCNVLKQHNIPFNHQAVLSKRTIPWIDNFFDLARESGSTSMNFTRLVMEGHAERFKLNNKDEPIVGEELREAYKRILNASRNVGISTTTSGPLWCLIEDGLGAPSNIGFNGIVIGYRGEIKVTSRTPVVLGNVLEDTLEDAIFNHPTMKRLRKGAIDICSECAYFSKCRGDRNASFATYGHFFGWDPGCWLKK